MFIVLLVYSCPYSNMRGSVGKLHITNVPFTFTYPVSAIFFKLA